MKLLSSSKRERGIGIDLPISLSLFLYHKFLHLNPEGGVLGTCVFSAECKRNKT